MTHTYPHRINGASRPLAVIGDTQRTSLVEMLIGYETNNRERCALIGALAEEAPGALVIVGDMVTNGSSSKQWDHFDRDMEPIRRLGIPVLSCMGNHDYLMMPTVGLKQARARFPHLRDTTWYHDVYGGLGLIFLDSNYDVPGVEWDAQVTWFRGMLNACDGYPLVRGVLVFAHHPPYTRSAVLPGDPQVRDDVLESMLKSPKALALISGHAHGYERYFYEGKHLIVTAGGGGPRPRSLRATAGPGLHDEYGGGAPRPFHYLLVNETERGVCVNVRGLDKGQTEIRDIESFEMLFAADSIERAGCAECQA